MVFGLQLTWWAVALVGIGAFALLAFQMLVGLRVIKFKGRTHLKVHKWGAWVLTGVAGFHGLMALAILYGWRVLS